VTWFLVAVIAVFGLLCMADCAVSLRLVAS
jgi:hypothetical protein